MEKNIKDYLRGEVWRSIPGFPFYQASNKQRIRSLDREVRHNYGGTAIKRGKILSQHINYSGYKSVGLCVNNRITTITAHRLIALAFVKNTHNKPTVNHFDGDKWNNKPNNLRWATHSENNQHAWDIGLNGNYEKSVAQLTFGVEAAKKPIFVMNVSTRKRRKYLSVSGCAKALKVTQSCVSQSLCRGNLILKKYNIKYAA